MNRQDDGGGLEEPVAAVERAQVDGNQRRLPIVTVDHRGRAALSLQEFQTGQREGREPLCIVPVIDALFPVEARTVEKLRAIDQVVLRAALAVRTNGLNVGEIKFTGQGKRQIGEGNRSRGRIPIAGKNDADLLSLLGQCPGQRADDVGQSAGLRERDPFGCRKYNV